MSNIRKSAPVFHTISKSNIDRELGVIRNVVIVNKGKDKYGDNIDATFLNQIKDQGNAQAQGVKSRFDHPNMCGTTFGYFIGRYKNFNVNDTSVTADLHLDPVSKTSPHGNLHDYVLNLSDTNPDMFGNSIVFAPDKDAIVAEKDAEGNDVLTPYIRCKSFIASDVVDSPAATESLFKSEDDYAAKATDFLNENPQIFEIVHKSPQILTEFLTKYSNYKSIMDKNKTAGSEELNLISKGIKAIQDLLNKDKKKSTDLATTDGKTITVENTGAEPAIGDACTMDGQPCPDGSYDMQNGNTITVAGGKITDIQPTQKEAPAPAPDAAAAEIKSLKSENADLKSKLDAQEKQVAEIKKSYETLQASLKAMSIDFNIETGTASLQAKNKKQGSEEISEVQKAINAKKEKDAAKK